MKKSINVNKKIWVKRIRPEQNEFDYIYIPKSQYMEVVKSVQLKISQNKPVYLILEKTPFWYSWYKTSKPYFNKWAVIIITLMIGAIITLIAEHFFGKKK
jgi:hypothetical protein